MLRLRPIISSLESRPIRVIMGFNFQNTRGNTATTRSTSTTSASKTSGRPTRARTSPSSTGRRTRHRRGTAGRATSDRAGETARIAPSSSTTPATVSTECGFPGTVPRKTCSLFARSRRSWSNYSSSRHRFASGRPCRVEIANKELGGIASARY